MAGMLLLLLLFVSTWAQRDLPLLVINSKPSARLEGRWAEQVAMNINGQAAGPSRLLPDGYRLDVRQALQNVRLYMLA